MVYYGHEIRFYGDHRPLTTDDVHDIKAFVDAGRTEPGPFDIVVEGETPISVPRQAAEQVHPWLEIGATWWIEALWPTPDRPSDPAAVRRRVDQGPLPYQQDNRPS